MFLHLLYNASCYIPLAFFLILTVGIFPAVALFPSLLRKPVFSVGIPIISILIVNLISIVLYQLNFFNHTEIIACTLIFALVAILRGHHYLRTHTLEWEPSDRYLLILNIGILLPLIAFTGLSTFMTNDAIASWNYWAILYAHGKVPDTMGYPPFFSFLLAYCYKILGTFEYQGPVKTLLVLLPFTIMNAIAFVTQTTKQRIFWYLLLVSVCVFPGYLNFSFYRFYSVGYADPLLAATTVASLLFILKYLEDSTRKSYLFFGTLCAITASLSKQPGLLWACVSLPLLIIFKSIITKKFDKAEWLSFFTLFVPATIWLFGPGSHFYNNPGVIQASTHHDSLTFSNGLASLLYSINKFLISQPSLLFLLIITLVACCRNKYKIFILLSFILPGLILWFIFGSYDMRLGLYLLGCMGLLIASENYLLDKKEFGWLSSLNFISLKKTSSIAATLGVIAFVTFSFTDQVNRHMNVPYQIYPLNAGLSNLHRYFGNQADFIYKEIYNHPNVKIWGPHRLTAGIFYGRTPIIPASSDMNSADSIYANLKQYQPDYVFVPFCDRDDYSDCKGIKQFIEKYPHVLTAIPIENTDYGYRLYSYQDREQYRLVKK